MDFWILLVVAAQFLSAAVVLVDKFLVTHPTLPRPAVYAFYIAGLSIVAVVVLPFGVVSIPTVAIGGYSLLAGFTYVIAILIFYSALQRADASDVVPVVGAAAAVTTFLFRFYVTDDPLPPHFVWGFLFLVVGTALISHYRFRWRGFTMVVIAGVLLGVSSMFIKLVFLHTGPGIAGFANGFFWTRMANVVAALSLLLWPPTLYAVTRHERSAAKRATGYIIANKTLAGVASLLVLVAISLGDVSLVNALGGLQFVFLFFFVLLCGKWFPEFFRDARSKQGLAQKGVAISIIVTGFFVLFL